jgi:hypothetical protein
MIAVMRIALFLLPICLIACGDNKVPAGGDDDGGDDDAGVDGPPGPDAFTNLATFDPAMGQQPEGVLSLNGEIFVSLANLGKVVKLNADGTFADFGTLPGVVKDTFTLGLAANAAGEIFVGVGQSGVAPVPPPGIYKIPAAGGTATLFASNANMKFPNALDFDGTDLYVSDSGSMRIFKVTAAGVAAAWINNAMLAGDMAACGGTGAPFVIGANGLVHDAMFRYVAVTDFGRILRIPINANGSAGTPEVLKEDCATLQGADGIALDDDGSLIIVRNGPSNTMVRLAADGTVTPLHAGAPLDGPASVVIDAPNGDKRAVITNSAFFSTPGTPGVVAFDLP